MASPGNGFFGRMARELATLAALSGTLVTLLAAMPDWAVWNREIRNWVPSLMGKNDEILHAICTDNLWPDVPVRHTIGSV